MVSLLEICCKLNVSQDVIQSVMKIKYTDDHSILIGEDCIVVKLYNEYQYAIYKNRFVDFTKYDYVKEIVEKIVEKMYCYTLKKRLFVLETIYLNFAVYDPDQLIVSIYQSNIYVYYDRVLLCFDNNNNIVQKFDNRSIINIYNCKNGIIDRLHFIQKLIDCNRLNSNQFNGATQAYYYKGTAIVHYKDGSIYQTQLIDNLHRKHGVVLEKISEDKYEIITYINNYRADVKTVKIIEVNKGNEKVKKEEKEEQEVKKETMNEKETVEEKKEVEEFKIPSIEELKEINLREFKKDIAERFSKVKGDNFILVSINTPTHCMEWFLNKYEGFGIENSESMEYHKITW